MFHLFKVYSYLTCRVNLAVDSIHHDRFIYERRFSKQRLGANFDHYHNQHHEQEDQDQEAADGREMEAHPQASEPQRKWPLGLVDDLIWMLEYNQLNLFHLLLFIMNVSILTINAALSICYILRPRERDPQTGNYLDPVLRFFESLYMIEILSRSDQSGMINQLALLICVPIIFARIECLLERIRMAKTNRHRYVKLDVIQLNVAQFDQLALKDGIRGLWRFMLALARHKCNRRRALHGCNGQRLRRIASRLQAVEKLDWLYHYNLVDFEGCYREAASFLAGPLRDYSSHRRFSFHQRQSGGHLGERIRRLCRRQHQQKRRLFAAHPFHRLHPHALLPLALVYMLAVVNIASIIGASVLTFYYPLVKERHGLRADNVLASFPGAFLVSLGEPKNLAALILVSFYVFDTAVNMIDTATLIHNAVTEQSRSNAVIEMLDVEIDIYRSYLVAFSNYLTSNNLTISGLTEHFDCPNPVAAAAAATATTTSQLLAQEESYTSSAPHRGLPFGELKQSDWEQFGDALYTAGPEDILARQANHLRHRSVAQLVQDFKLAMVDQSKLIVFNENIKYLLNLIRVLQSEQADLKKHFTWSLNISVLAGTVGVAISSFLFYNCQSLHHFLSILSPTFTIVFPLIVSLIMGATSEGSFRKIIQKLRPLMVNELRLVDEKVASELQSIYSYLSLIENRSFMILGNLPLTFGSLTSIIGWIASCNLLFQRLFQP